MKSMGICFLSFMGLFLLSIFMLIMGLFFGFNDIQYFIEWEFVNLNSVGMMMTLLFDWMSFTFMGFVLMISSLVILYSGDYMIGDKNMDRFIILILLFVLSMMMMIISPNMISILLGWDGLGLISYCLVVYYQNNKSFNAGMLTALSNRIGDVALLMVIAWMMNFGSWNYIFYLDCLKGSIEMKVICILVVLAAMTKSAQIPFSSWLPAAMAAPTPVSALVHSSTLVTAGVYLLIRFEVAFSDGLKVFLMFIACLTMFMAGLGANYEFDLKSIIALSTLSQLGLMIGILAIGYANLAFFHLLMHALFKALLFMCAGVIIHFMNNSQDIRYMGSLSLQMPLTSSCMMVSNFSLCGMPFLAGFYSKDLILEVLSMEYLNVFCFVLFYISTGLTVSYSFRLFNYVLSGDVNLMSLYTMGEENFNMMVGMNGLLFMVIFSGGFMSWVVFPTPELVVLPLLLKMFVVIVSIMGVYLGMEVSMMSLGGKLLFFDWIKFYTFTGSMWFLPYITTYGIMLSPMYVGYKTIQFVDCGWSEYFGGQGIYNYLIDMSKVNQIWQFSSFSMFFIIILVWFLMMMFM
uniref:NADH dehydrogenase subunit 5 n=1 Tax=Margattea limbata TaxID=3037043 RepID=UPI0027A82BC8|nr:NADH dehydrogenase subunit 5 [Margattea limbata]WGO57763.1 NADH dehydrogenase subunit 5 [Margattea limbata]